MKAYHLMNINVITVLPETTLEEIAHLMATFKLDSVLVGDERRQLIGLVDASVVGRPEQATLISQGAVSSQIDHATRLESPNDNAAIPPRPTAWDVMTRTIECVDIDDDASDVAWLMRQHDLHTVLVLVNNEVVGTIARKHTVGLLPYYA
jgi:CBS domain-containing protein